MDKIKHFKLIGILFIAMLTNISNLKAQGTCSSPLTLNHQTDTNVFVSDSVMWVEYIAESSYIAFQSTPQNSSQNINKIRLYSGSCSNLNPISQSETNLLQFEGLVTDSTYYIKVEIDSILSDTLEITCMATQVITVNFSVSQDICLGDSFLITDLSIGFSGGLASSYDYFYNWDYGGGATNDSFPNLQYSNLPMQPFYKTFNNSIDTFWITLTIYWYSSNTNLWGFDLDSVRVIVHDTASWGHIRVLSDYTCDSIFLVTDSSYNLMSSHGMPGGFPNGISWGFYDYNFMFPYSYTFYSNPTHVIDIKPSPNYSLTEPLAVGQYALTMTATSYCGDIITDSINFFITGGTPEITGTQQMCLGDTAMFIGSSACPDIWQWNFGDGTTTSGNDTVYHVYSQLGTYQVTLQTNTGGVLGQFSIEVIQPELPIITGYQNTCDSIVFYTIENYDSNYTYTWSTQTFDQNNNTYTNGTFIINGLGNTVTADSAFIYWNPLLVPTLPSYMLITVESQLIESNCSAISTFKVYQCCEGDMGMGGLYWHDTTITDAHYLSSQNIAINGTVYLHDSLVMYQGGLFLGAHAKIVLDSGAYFELIDGDIRKGCDYMWDGIYTNSPNESIKVAGSNVSDAINGLVSTNGGTMLLDTVYFSENYVSVQLLNHKSLSFPYPPPTFIPANIRVSNCTFNVNVLPQYKLSFYPYYNYQPKTGIYISNMEDIIIGDSSTGRSEFQRMEHGIIIYNSKVSIVNSYFKELENFLMPVPTSERGAIVINSYSMFNMDNIGDVTIGGIGNQGNEFDSCYHSITSSNSKLSVINNDFKYGHQSIDVYNFKNGTNIEDNRFRDVYFGIRVNNLLGVNRKLDIYNNIFGGISNNTYTQVTREAINTINCNSQVNSSNKVKIANNTIKFAGQKNFITSGIRVQNCDGIMVNSNHVQRMTNPTVINADWEQTIGIRTATSQFAQITDNYVWGFGKSIETYGTLTGTQYSCNDLKIYRYGFYWGAFTYLSDQGIYDTTNTHNEWASHPAINNHEKLAQGLSANNILNTDTIQWFYFSSFSNSWIPNDVTNTYNIIKITPLPNDSATHLCVGGSGAGASGTSTGGGTPNGGGSLVLSLIDSIEDPELRDFMFEDLMMGEEYLDLQNEYRAYDADFLYKMLADDTTMMFLGGDSDADYQYFFDSIQKANIGEFKDVYDFIEAGNYEEAVDLNNAIVPEQEIFVNLKTVLGIYLDSWCNERYDLSTLEYETLFEIANQTPYEAGDAVYTARIMIGFEPDEHGVSYRMQKPKQIKEKDELFLYPNPASTQVTVQFKNENFENINAQIKIYTLTGSLIYQAQFNTNHSFKVLSIDMLKNGIYIYNISMDNGIDKSGKLVILKQ